MKSVSNAFKEAMVNPYRVIKASLKLSNGAVYTEKDAIKSLDIQRIGDSSKFYGFGVCHRLNVKLIDLDNIIEPETGSSMRIELGIQLPNGTTEYVSFPTFYLSQKNRDEEEEITSLTAYDALYAASGKQLLSIGFPDSFTLRTYVNILANTLGLAGVVEENIPANDSAMFFGYGDIASMVIAEDDEVIGTDKENSGLPNFDGSESVRYALDCAAEAASCIYFVNGADQLVFKRLDRDGVAVLHITPEDYITLDHSANKRINSICHTTELGDNVQASLNITGTTQYIRDNPFWELREEIGDLVEYALSVVGGLSINQFDCNWRGNLVLEVGDKIETIGTDGQVKCSYVLDDTILYEGHLAQKTRWEYTVSEGETSTNPSTLGEKLNSTAAKVDKINQKITMYAKKTDENSSNIANMVINTEAIIASVERIETNFGNELEGVQESVERLTSRVEAGITAEDVKIEIQKIREEGVNSITTTTGFTFNDEGLTVSKTGSEMTTQITEDGMIVYRDETQVLTADNQGVHAINLTATQYLVVGKNSRFEDYIKNNEERTGCFWIGE